MIAALQLMMKAKSAEMYKIYRADMLRSLGNDKNAAFLQYFKTNWETCKNEWVDYHRDNLPHLNNHTNNRIESGWGKIKQLLNRGYAIDETISTLILLQEWSHDGYMKEFKSLGTRQTPDPADATDPELLTLTVQLSPHAYRLVRDQYKFARSADARYDVKVDGTTAELRMLSDGNEHTVHVVNTMVRLFCTVQYLLYYFVPFCTEVLTESAGYRRSSVAAPLCALCCYHADTSSTTNLVAVPIPAQVAGPRAIAFGVPR